jgi:hypothetical protein
MDFLFSNWAEIALIIITAAGSWTALTETDKDDKFVDVLKRILQAVVLGKSRRRPKN